MAFSLTGSSKALSLYRTLRGGDRDDRRWRRWQRRRLHKGDRNTLLGLFSCDCGDSDDAFSCLSCLSRWHKSLTDAGKEQFKNWCDRRLRKWRTRSENDRLSRLFLPPRPPPKPTDSSASDTPAKRRTWKCSKKPTEKRQLLQQRLNPDTLARSASNRFELLELAGDNEPDHGFDQEGHSFDLTNRLKDPAWSTLTARNPDRLSRSTQNPSRLSRRSSRGFSAERCSRTLLRSLSRRERFYSGLEPAFSPRRFTSFWSRTNKRRTLQSKRLSRLSSLTDPSLPAGASDFDPPLSPPWLTDPRTLLPPLSPPPSSAQFVLSGAFFGTWAPRQARPEPAQPEPPHPESPPLLEGPPFTPECLFLPSITGESTPFLPHWLLEGPPQSPPSFKGPPLSLTDLGFPLDRPRSPPSFDGPPLSPTDLGFPLDRPQSTPSFNGPPLPPTDLGFPLPSSGQASLQGFEFHYLPADVFDSLLPTHLSDSDREVVFRRSLAAPTSDEYNGLALPNAQPDPDTQGTFRRRQTSPSQALKAHLLLFRAKQACEPWAERQNGTTGHADSGTALGSAYSSLRYSSAHFKPQFPATPLSPTQNPWGALHNLKSLADLGSAPAARDKTSRPCCARHSDLESTFADDLLHLSSLEFRKPQSLARGSKPPSRSRPSSSLAELPEEENEEEFASCPSPSHATLTRRSRLSCHLNNRSITDFLTDLHAQHQELLAQAGAAPSLPRAPSSSPADRGSWSSDDSESFTTLSHRDFASAYLGRAGFGPSALLAQASFAGRRHRHLRFLSRDIGSWRKRLRVVKALREQDARLRAVLR